MGCSSTKRVTIFNQSTALATQRFVGPVHIEVPRRRDHEHHDFEIRVALTARCLPELMVRFPDGEVRRVGAHDGRWQELLAARAEAVSITVASASESSHQPSVRTAVEATVEPAIETAAPTIEAPGIGGAPGQPVETGRWVERDVDSWPGQMEFMRRRDINCAERRTYTIKHINAYDERGQVSVWAEVPQEIADGVVEVTVVELVRQELAARTGRRMAKRGQAKPRPVKPAPVVEEKQVEPEVAVVVERPPKPKPRIEKPRLAVAEGARWVPGYWGWSGTRGRWVWISGKWAPPARSPGLRVENHGVPPVVGCTWQRGRWVWVPGNGSWKWRPGYWNAPPPKVENRGQPAGAGAPWYAGRWQRRGDTFVWIKGRWGRPALKKESKPPRPNAGARWVAGFWHATGGTYVWVSGSWIGGSGRSAPPPPKNETRPPMPAEGAIWLAGFWRFEVVDTRYVWVSGHYEIPPGKDYIWVPDPPAFPGAQVTSGHWRIRVDVDATIDTHRGGVGVGVGVEGEVEVEADRGGRP